MNRTNNNRKVLLIGFDGGTWTILKPAMEKGYMPFVKSMYEDGSSGILESTMPAITPAAWGGFQTGKNPGKTGVFDFAYWNKDEKKSHYVNSLDLGETIWDTLSKYGKRIGVVNVPLTYPPKPLNGYLITGLPTPSMKSEFTWPPELKAQLVEAVPDYHIFDLNKISEYRSEDDLFEKTVHQFSGILENRTKAALFILQKEPLDVFMIHFQSTDVLQHVYWHFLDSTHPLFSPAKQTYLFEHFYRVLDKKVEAIFNAFKKQNGTPLTLIISDHGFQAHYKRYNIGNWLVQEGYMGVYKRNIQKKVPILKKITYALKLGKIIGIFISKALIQKIDNKYISKNEQCNWNETKAFSMGRSNEGFIYLLPQNENGKRVLAQELRRKLLKIKDPQTGEAVAKRVWLKNELYQGEKLVRLPDIIIEPADKYSFTGYYQPNEGIVHEVVLKKDMHIGKHHPHGIVIVTGSEIRKDCSMHIKIIDIAPTVLSYLGIPVPKDMDGSVISNIVIEKNANEPPHLSILDSMEYKIPNSRYDSKEENEIEQRLKDLGYL
jgi:predicted AlkP superfamily phosphohydrolase/phosphomutase